MKVKNTIFRIVLRSMLLWLGFSACYQVSADHVLGGEIFYTHIYGNKYKFTLYMYRDCAGCEFNSGNCSDIKPLEVFVSPDVIGYIKKVATIPLQKVGKEDVTPVCKTGKSRCNGGSTSIGIEKLEYEGFLDFDTISKEYCNFEISEKVETRMDAYGTNTKDAFYNFTRINICNGTNNSSPLLQAPAYHLLQLNQSFTYNPLAADPDGDSLSYELASAQKGFNSSISYPSGLGSTKPLNIHCPAGNCALNESSWPVEGIGIHSDDGWMGFTPVLSGQKGFLVIQITEWRKINGTFTKVGITRRDVAVSVLDNDNFAPRIQSPSYNYFACAGDEFTADIIVSDPAVSGLKDTVGLAVFSDISGAFVQKIAGSSPNQYDAFFSSSKKLFQSSSKPHFFTIVAYDGHCPLEIATYKTFHLTITPQPLVKHEISYTKCNLVHCQSTITEKNVNHSWFLKGADHKLLDNTTGVSGGFKVPSPGKYYILHQATNSVTGCQMEVLDSLIVPYFSPLKDAINWPEYSCKNSEVTLEAVFSGGVAPFKYEWGGTAGSSRLTFKIPADTAIALLVRDDVGCELAVRKVLKVFASPEITLLDTSICLSSNGSVFPLSEVVKISPQGNGSNTVMWYLGTAGKLTQNAQKEYGFLATRAANNTIFVNHTDENGCVYNGSLKLKVVQAAPTGITNPSDVCNNANPFDLNVVTGCLLSGGIWKSIEGRIVSNGYFNPNGAGAGNHQVTFSVDIGGCIVRDTVEINVLAAPDVFIYPLPSAQFCGSDADIKLDAEPKGGVWSNSEFPAQQNLFSPSAVIQSGRQSNTFHYKYTDAGNGCASQDEITLKVNPPVVLGTLANVSLCPGEKLDISVDANNAESVGFKGTAAHLKIDQNGNSYTFTPEDVASKFVQQISFKAVALPGCEDATTSFELTIKPKPVLQINATGTEGCEPMLIVLEALNDKPNAACTSFTWKYRNSESIGTAIFEMPNTTAGQHTVEVWGSYDGCLSDIVTQAVIVYPTPKAIISVSPETKTVTSDYPSISFTDASASISPYSLQWIFEKGNPAESKADKVTVSFPGDTGLYSARLKLTNAYGCKSEAMEYIRVRPGLRFYVPNGFTPDAKGPGANESFGVTMDSTVTFHLTVRNKWGQIVFKSDNQNARWNGEYMGETVPAGAYLWELEANTIYGKYVKRGGTVLLIR